MSLKHKDTCTMSNHSINIGLFIVLKTLYPILLSAERGGGGGIVFLIDFEPTGNR